MDSLASPDSMWACVNVGVSAMPLFAGMRLTYTSTSALALAAAHPDAVSPWTSPSSSSPGIVTQFIETRASTLQQQQQQEQSPDRSGAERSQGVKRSQEPCHVCGFCVRVCALILSPPVCRSFLICRRRHHNALRPSPSPNPNPSPETQAQAQPVCEKRLPIFIAIVRECVLPHTYLSICIYMYMGHALSGTSIKLIECNHFICLRQHPAGYGGIDGHSHGDAAGQGLQVELEKYRFVHFICKID